MLLGMYECVCVYVCVCLCVCVWVRVCYTQLSFCVSCFVSSGRGTRTPPPPPCTKVSSLSELHNTGHLHPFFRARGIRETHDRLHLDYGLSQFRNWGFRAFGVSSIKFTMRDTQYEVFGPPLVVCLGFRVGSTLRK